MHVYDTYEGNYKEAAAIDDLVDERTVETVTVGDDQRRRSRFRATTDDGTEVGVVVARELRAGDVLSAGEGQPLVRIALEPVDALVVDLAGADGALATAVALGHAAGNRHWDMAVRDDAVLFPATESLDRMRETVEPHLPSGAGLRRESVSPATFDGGAVGHGTDDSGHAHGHDHGGGHVHVGDLRRLSEPGGDGS